MTISPDYQFLSRFYTKYSIVNLTDEEVEQLRKAAKAGDAYAQYGFARWLFITNPYRGSLRDAERLFYANKDTIPDSMASYAWMLRFGETEVTHPAEVDAELFLELLNQSVSRGSELGAIYYSRIRIYGVFCEAEPQQVYDEIQLRLYDDPEIHPSWHLLLGYACEELNLEDEAIEQYEKAIERGLLTAYLNLYGLYSRRGNKALAEEYLEEGCEKGVASCLFYQSDFDNEYFQAMPPQDQQELHDKIDQRLHAGVKQCESICAYFLWSNYFYGSLGYPVDKKKAFEYLERGMQLYDSSSFWIMAMCAEDDEVPDHQYTPAETAEFWLKAVRYGYDDEDSLRGLSRQTDEAFLQKHQAEIDKYWRPLWEKLPPVEDAPEEVMETDDYDDEDAEVEVGEDSWKKPARTYPVYKGEWQFGDTILQRLEGPIGKGEVSYSNGDHFEGFFHLNYASIYGPAYAADGRYTFADGSYIEQAWITTSSRGDEYNLHGVFRIHHPEGPDSICMFVRHQRCGFELFLDSNKPLVREWYADELLDTCWEVMSYELDETSKVDCIHLKLTLRGADGSYVVSQQGGRYAANQYDSYYYVPSTSCSVTYPNGDSIDHYGDDLRALKPYHGYLTRHCVSTGKKRSEEWENGELKNAEQWERDYDVAREEELPNPMNPTQMLKASVFEDGHIRLHVKSGHSSWSISSQHPWEYEEYDMEAQLGQLDIRGFRDVKIARIEKQLITLSDSRQTYLLAPDKPLHLSCEIEGREWSDGCVYDGDDYTLDLTWLND